MSIRTLSPTLSVSPQVLPHQVAALARKGFRSVICNLPDGDGGSGFAQIPATAKAAGIEAAHLPIRSGEAGPHDLQAFRDRMDRLPTPTLAFCRSGNRSASLWSMAHSVHA